MEGYAGELDEQLMHCVNLLGVLTFASIIVYHFVTATQKDAEMT
jgi:hypothetical protein